MDAQGPSQGSLQQSANDDDTSTQIANLKFTIMDLQMEINALGKSLGFMKVTFNDMYTAALKLPHEAQIAHLGKLVGMLQKFLDRAANKSLPVPAGAAATDSQKGQSTLNRKTEHAGTPGRKRKQRESLEHARSEQELQEQNESLEPRKKHAKKDTALLEFVRCSIECIRTRSAARPRGTTVTVAILVENYARVSGQGTVRKPGKRAAP